MRAARDGAVQDRGGGGNCSAAVVSRLFQSVGERRLSCRLNSGFPSCAAAPPPCRPPSRARPPAKPAPPVAAPPKPAASRRIRCPEDYTFQPNKRRLNRVLAVRPRFNLLPSLPSLLPSPPNQMPDDFSGRFRKTACGSTAPLRTAPAVDSAGHVIVHVQGRLVAIGGAEWTAVQFFGNMSPAADVPGPVVLGADDSIRLHCRDGCLHGVSSRRQAALAAGDGRPAVGLCRPGRRSRGQHLHQRIRRRTDPCRCRTAASNVGPLLPLCARSSTRPASSGRRALHRLGRRFHVGHPTRRPSGA